MGDAASGATPEPPCRRAVAEPEVIVYRRDGCHLCDEALAGLGRLRGEGLRFRLRELDIEADDALLRGMLERIPVVEVGGEVVSELVFDPEAVRAALVAAGAPREGAAGGTPRGPGTFRP